MALSVALASLLAGAVQAPAGGTALRGSLLLERPAAGARHVLAHRLADGAGPGIDQRMLFDRAPDVRGVADEASSFVLAAPPGAYALFAFVDVDGDGAWTPAVPEPCGQVARADAGPQAAATAITLRAPTHLPRHDRAVANGALRWLRGHPVVQLRGDAQQRGFAHGELLAAQIVDVFRCYVLEDRLGSADRYREFARFLETAFDWPPALLTEVDAMLEGMRASGADLTVPELGRPFGRTELLAINAYIESRAMRSSCTQFAAWGERTAGTDVAGGTIAGRNMDGEIDLRRVTVSHFVLFAVAPSEPGHRRFVSAMWPGFVGTLSGFNEAGVHCMENAGGTGPGPVVTKLRPMTWIQREALVHFGADATPADFERLLAANANAAGGACAAGGIVLFALPSSSPQPAWVLEGDRFGHATRLPGEVPPLAGGVLAASNHHLRYGADPARPGTSFGKPPSFASHWRYEAGRHRLEGWLRTGRPIGTAEMRELLQTVAHGTTEHSVITRPDAREIDVAVASMRAEPWDAPYRAWTTYSFAELFAPVDGR
jgi:hypothetical protein